MLAAALSEEEYHVATAANGTAALDRLVAAPVDLILCDFMMPDMNGVEVLRQYCQICPPPHAPAILMTASLQLPPGTEELLAKPFDLDALLAMIDQHLGSGWVDP
jgi:CheY-like chemotaxis protein